MANADVELSSRKVNSSQSGGPVASAEPFLRKCLHQFAGRRFPDV